MIPVVVATAATLALAVPSFVMLEPHSATEPLGALPLALACSGMGVLFAGVWNSVASLVRASRAVRRWSMGTSEIGPRLGSAETASVLRTSAAAPPLTVAGILKPTVWLSRTAEFILNERELQSALRHEFVHVRRRDNLRKLMLRAVAFPGMMPLEDAWREATEMAADDAAVSSATEALDLAAAVIKLSRLVPLHAPAELTTALVHSPAESVNARVQRLIEWTGTQSVPADRNFWRYAPYAVTLVAGLAVTYGGLLIRVHEATEWLVR